jgi:nitrous oxidase accessory protein
MKSLSRCPAGPLPTRPGCAGGVKLLASLLLALLLSACDAGPQPIRIGEDRCAFCVMGIAEATFASELVTRRGRVHTFDSIECLAAYVETRLEEGDLRSAWVTDYREPPRLIEATTAAYLRGDAVRSPMGLGLAAFASAAARDSVLRDSGGDAMDWDGVRALVRRTWPSGTPDAERHEADSTGAAAPAEGSQVVEAGVRGSLAEAIARAAPGDRILVRPGRYLEPTLVIDKPLELVGEGEPVLDGEGERQLIVIRSDSVTIRGLVLRNTGKSFVDDRSAIRVEQARDCRIEENRIEDGHFGIYLARAAGCVIAGNRIEGKAERESQSGNGIHLWYSRGVTIRDNVIRGHRDGIYFEFAKDSRVEDNVSEGNVRYGLHFMFSDSSVYRGNVFRSNRSGVAVMYTSFVDMEDNRFLDNWGSATFGLLLKDIRDSRIAGNRFERNSIGIYAEGSDRMQVERNDFVENGWAVKLMANSEDNLFTANNFEANSFDVSTNSRLSYSTFEGNYWDEYSGYDLDRDGTGDVAFRPVRLFSLIVEQNEPSLILLRSFLVSLLDAAEAVIPALTPETLADAAPRMRPIDLEAKGRAAT